MSEDVAIIGETVIWFAPEAGPPLKTEQDAMDLIADSFGREAQWVAMPATRFDPEFWDLSTRTAGLFAQKLVTYRLGLAVIGDIEDRLAASKPLRDFVRETNRGDMLWFLPDRAAVEDKLAGR